MQLQGFYAYSEAQFKVELKAEGKLHKSQALLRATAKPDLPTSLSGKADEEMHTGLQQRATEIKAIWSSDGSNLH